MPNMTNNLDSSSNNDTSTPSQLRFRRVRALRHPQLTVSHKAMLLLLTGYGNKYGWSCPRIKSMAAELCLSEDRIKRIIKDLCDLDMVKRGKLPQQKGKGRQNRNHYTVMV